MERGLYPLHHGFWLNDIIFPPSEFAMAFVGNTPAKQLEDMVGETIDGLLSGDILTSEAEFMAIYQAELQHREGRDLNLDDFRTLAERRFKSKKLIDRIAVQEVNKSRNLGTVSVKSTVSGEVTSREWGQRQRDYDITLVRPFARSADSPTHMVAQGGTKHATKHLSKGCHWDFEREHEIGFVSVLEKDIKKRYGEHKTHIRPQDVIDDYYDPVSIIDYPRAAMLDMLHRMHKQGSFRIWGQNPDSSVIIPYDFHSKPHLALEGVLRVLHHPGKNGLAMKDVPRQLLHEVDSSYIGKRGFITPLFRQMFENGKVVRGTLPAFKKTPDYSWAVLQGFELHCYRKNRRFDKYSLEFPGTPHETVSIVLEEEGSGRSTRLLYSDHFKRPYYLTKYFKPLDFIRNRKGLSSDPLTKINFSEDVHNFRRRRYTKEWVETDYRTGKPCICRLHEPDKRILNYAHEFSKRHSFKGILPITLMVDYRNIYKQATSPSRS